MAWVELQIVGLPSHKIHLLTTQLFELGAAGTQEDYLPGEAPAPLQPWDRGPAPPEPEHVILKAWFQDPDPQHIEKIIRPSLEGKFSAIRWDVVPETDWEEAWKEGFEPIEISADLTISPPWNAPADSLIIDPGQAFGTGKHPSTLASIRAAHELCATNKTLLDVGCGSGIVALVGARGGLQVSGIDVDANSIHEANRNAKLNALEANFSLDAIGTLTEIADIVICNLYAEAIQEMASDLLRLTGSWLVLAGLLVDREALVRKEFDQALTLDRRYVEGEWVCLWYRRG
jgi:ribosomal protein L11 methyltransferase